jgi:hypothetical protein
MACLGVYLVLHFMVFIYRVFLMFSWNCLSRCFTGVDCPDVSLGLLVLRFTWVIVFTVHGITCTWYCFSWYSYRIFLMFSWNCLSRCLTGVDCSDVYLEWFFLMFSCDYLFCCLPGIACLGVYIGLLGLVFSWDGLS